MPALTTRIRPGAFVGRGCECSVRTKCQARDYQEHHRQQAGRPVPHWHLSSDHVLSPSSRRFSHHQAESPGLWSNADSLFIPQTGTARGKWQRADADGQTGSLRPLVLGSLEVVSDRWAGVLGPEYGCVRGHAKSETVTIRTG